MDYRTKKRVCEAKLRARSGRLTAEAMGKKRECGSAGCGSDNG